MSNRSPRYHRGNNRGVIFTRSHYNYERLHNYHGHSNFDDGSRHLKFSKSPRDHYNSRRERNLDTFDKEEESTNLGPKEGRCWKYAL